MSNDPRSQEQFDFLQQVLRRNPVSRRSVLKGSVGAAGAAFLLGAGGRASASTFSDILTTTGTVADGFVVNGRHLGFGDDPRSEMWVAGQLFNLHRYDAVPSRIEVYVEYGVDHTYGEKVKAELRHLVTHVPVWNGVASGPVKASTTDILHANQYYVHAGLKDLTPGQTYHYRFAYKHGTEVGYTPDATFSTAPSTGKVREAFTFTALGDQGITGQPGTGLTLDNAKSLQPESSTHVTDDYYDPTDPDYYDPTSKTAPTDISPVDAIVDRIAKLRNPVNGSKVRFHLVAGDMCYANPSGNGVAIINPDGVGGTQPGDGNTPNPPANSGGWDDFDPWVWTSYLSNIQPSAAQTPWMFATGNHDIELFSTSLDADRTTVENYGSLGYGGHKERLDLPKTGPSKCPSVYSFTYSNVAVISVDANDLSWEIQGLLDYSKGSQARWLREKLKAFRADPEIDFIVAFYHHCAFSTCSGHGSDGGVRSTLAPLFEEFKVDLAIQGHNHIYERTNPIRYDAKTNTGTSSVQAVSKSAKEAAVVRPEHDGTTYVLVGTGGRPHYDWSGSVETDRNFIIGVDDGKTGNGSTVPGSEADKTGPYVSQKDFTDIYETIDWSQARYSDYGFVALDVVPAEAGATTTMTLRAINEQGVEFDRVVFKRTAGEAKKDAVLLP
jgi:hypothetical protein